jgi:hypothetical protein
VDPLEGADLGLVCLCGYENFERVVVQRAPHAPIVTDFVACVGCKSMYFAPMRKPDGLSPERLAKRMMAIGGLGDPNYKGPPFAWDNVASKRDDERRRSGQRRGRCRAYLRGSLSAGTSGSSPSGIVSIPWRTLSKTGQSALLRFERAPAAYKHVVSGLPE